MIEKRSYLATLTKRRKDTRAYHRHQAVGAELAEILGDPRHTALYIKLAKEKDEQLLRALARAAADNKAVRNPGAYFMRLLQEHKSKS